MPPHHTGIAFRLAQIVNAARARVSAHAAELDVDDAAGADLDGGARVLDVVDAFVEANRRFELALQLRVANRCRPSRAAARS